MRNKEINLAKTTLEEFKILRHRRRWTVEYAATQLGCSKGHLSSVMKGDRLPSRKLLFDMFWLVVSNQLDNNSYSNSYSDGRG